jgi:outer membrane protein assembly factor BamB
VKSGSPILLTLATILTGCGSGISSLSSQEAWSVMLDQRFVDPYPGAAAGNFICFAYNAKWPRDDDHRDGAGVFIALDAASGHLAWKQPATLGTVASSSTELMRGLILIGDGMLFYRGADNGIHALDAATGREKWKTATFVDGYIYAEAEPGKPGSVKGILPAFGTDSYSLVIESVDGEASGVKFHVFR